MVDLSLFSDWKCCNACGLPSDPNPNSANANQTNRTPRPPTKLMACADCSCVAYHNATCQKSHWRSSHKRECKELACAMLPLKELIRWHKMYKKVKNNNLELGVTDARESLIGGDGSTLVASGAGGKRVWCWWEPDNENGITDETLKASNDTWQMGVQRWAKSDYLLAMEEFQNSLEPYRKAWPYIGKSSGTNEKREENLNHFFERSFMLARKLLFCAYCELDARQVDSARQRLVQCLSITMTVFFTTPSRASRESIRNVMNDAWMELMLR